MATLDLAALVFLLLLGVHSALPSTLQLQRVLPQGIPLNELRLLDQGRHQRIGVVDFPLLATPSIYNLGFYMTRVKIGSPQREFNLVVDTASHTSWVSCIPCSGCPVSNAFGIQLGFYDPHNSTSVSTISCSSRACKAIRRTSNCSSQGSQCHYSIGYLDKAVTAGYLVSDIFHLYTVTAGSGTKNVSAPIIFGCTTHRSENLDEAHKAFDGILSLSPHDNSLISQLSSQGMIPNVFTHCFRRGGHGGGILVFGEFLEPTMVYTPLVTSRGLYDLNLQSIAVNGKIVPIDRAVFASKNERTIIDSGTTLAVLADKAYSPFIHSINAVASQYSRPVVIDGDEQCFEVSSRIDDIFPTVNFNFEGNASMILKPKDYLVWIAHSEGVDIWCIGFQKIEGQSVTILGGTNSKAFYH